MFVLFKITVLIIKNVWLEHLSYWEICNKVASTFVICKPSFLNLQPLIDIIVSVSY